MMHLAQCETIKEAYWSKLIELMKGVGIDVAVGGDLVIAAFSVERDTNWLPQKKERTC